MNTKISAILISLFLIYSSITHAETTNDEKTIVYCPKSISCDYVSGDCYGEDGYLLNKAWFIAPHTLSRELKHWSNSSIDARDKSHSITFEGDFNHKKILFCHYENPQKNRYTPHDEILLFRTINNFIGNNWIWSGFGHWEGKCEPLNSEECTGININLE